jgi:hypothetical protein
VRRPFAQAHLEALKSNPTLYVAYLREHDADLGVSRG